MRDLTKELLTLKEQLERRKILRAEAKGRLDELFRRLEEDFHCQHLGEAEVHLEDLLEEVKKLRQEIEAGLEEVAQKLGGIGTSTKG